MSSIDNLTEVLTGARATADLINTSIVDPLINGILMVRKAANEAVTSSTTLQDDDELFLAVQANSIYFVQGWFRYVSANATPDLKLNYTYPAGASFTRTDWGAPSTTTSAADTINTTVQTTGDSARGADTNNRSIYMMGELTTGATAGTFRVQWAQNTSDAGSVTMLGSSRLMMWKYS